MKRQGSIFKGRRLAAGVGVLARGLSLRCGGSTAGDARPVEPLGDAGKAAAAWCTGAMALSNSSQGDAACVVKSDGTLWCWGTNGCGSLGVTGTTFAAAPVAVPRDGLGSGVKSISLGWGTACAVERSGAAACWGNSLPGDVSTCSEMPTPTPISGLPSDISAITAGSDHACAISTEQSAWCWGTNTLGQLGDGTETTQTTPVPVFGMSSGIAGVSAGGNHTCAVKTDGSTWCWGYNVVGELGDGTAELIRLVPVSVKLPLGAKAVAVGYMHTCAIATDGSVWCWGDNRTGELGSATEPCDATLCSNPNPTQVSGLPSEVVSITAAYLWTCALERDGTVWCLSLI